MANISRINDLLINAATASLATTASHALNGGVTSIVAGTNITISPTNGLGAVTINSSGGGGGSSFPFTGSAIISGSLTVTGSTNINGALSATSITSSGNTFLNGNVLLKGTLANNQGLTIQDRNGATVVSLPTEANGIMYSGSTYSLNIGGGGSTAKVTIQGNGTINSSLNTLFRDNNLTAILSIYDGGNIGIGNITPSFSLDVNGAARFRSGITGSLSITGSLITPSFNFVSSSLTQSRVLLDNTFDNTAISAASPNAIRDRSSLLRVYGTYTTASTSTAPSNQIISTHIYPTFNPVNNTLAVFNTLVLEPQFLNPLATGSARGLYVTPGFSGNHPGWRSIEWDNGVATGWGLYGSGDAPNYLNGSLSIKTLSTSSTLNVNGNTEITGSLIISGSITAPGAVNEVLFNSASVIGAAANVEIESGNLKLVSTSDPATPTGGIISYSKVIAGRHLPKIIGPSGIDTIMQVGLHGNSVFLVSPTNGTTAPGVLGGLISTAGTGTNVTSHQQTIASANPWLATRKTRFTTGTTINNNYGIRTQYVQWFRGSVTGFGGFWFRAQFGQSINLTGGQKFVGLCNSTNALGGDPSALLNMCGMGYDAADLNTGNWQFMYNDGTGTATRVDLGANAVRNTTAGYDLIMYMAPGGSELFVRIINLATNVTVLETSYTSLLPVANIGMAFAAQVRTTTAAANDIEVAKVYIESDY